MALAQRNNRYCCRRSLRLHAGRVAGVAAAIFAICTGALSQPLKPKLPSGRDPGGSVIGLMTTGLDPTRPEVARCLARDGEGEVIGWDMVDRIREPFRRASPGQPGDESQFENLTCDGRARVVPVRINPADSITHGKALAFFSTTPARVVVIPAANVPSDWLAFLQAAAAFPQLLILVEAEPRRTTLDRSLNIVAVAPGTAMSHAAQLAPK